MALTTFPVTFENLCLFAVFCSVVVAVVVILFSCFRFTPPQHFYDIHFAELYAVACI